MKNKEIFKVGDTVYHWEYGKGVVSIIDDDVVYPMVVSFEKNEIIFTRNGALKPGGTPLLSFTPYDFIKGGFSQERPLPDIEVDTLVYVKNGSEWIMRYFSHFEDGYIFCFIGQGKRDDTRYSTPFIEWSLTNPLEEK